MLKKILIFILRLIFGLFYQREYLKGRWFDNSLQGWLWCSKGLIYQKILRINSHVKFPVSPNIKVSLNYKLQFHPDNIDNFQGIGNYYQCNLSTIKIGHGTYIAPNVGLITSNHDVKNLDLHESGMDIILGNDCWIGMNSVLLPGTVLGNKTIVGAGSVVTKSFEDGNCIIAGNPARLIRKLGL